MNAHLEFHPDELDELIPPRDTANWDDVGWEILQGQAILVNALDAVHAY